MDAIWYSLHYVDIGRHVCGEPILASTDAEAIEKANCILKDLKKKNKIAAIDEEALLFKPVLVKSW